MRLARNNKAYIAHHNKIDMNINFIVIVRHLIIRQEKMSVQVRFH